MKRTTTIPGAVVVVALAAASAGCGEGGGGASRRAFTGAASVGTRVLAGSLVEPRAGHQAVAVDDGRSVLLVGGATLTAGATATAELWRAGRSEPLPVAMTEPRAGHRALLLPTGEVWIVGGHDAGGRALATTELFDPASQTFRPGPRLLAPRDEAAVAYTEAGYVIAFGRGQGTIETWSRDLSSGAQAAVKVTSRELNARTGEWTSKVAAAEGRRGAQAVTFEGGALFVNGGTLDSGAPGLPLWVRGGDARVAPGQPHQTGEHHVTHGTAVAATLDGATRGAYVLGGAFDGQAWLHLQRVRPEDTALERQLGGLLFARERATVVALGRGVLVAGGRVGGFARAEVEVVLAGGNGVSPSLQVARYDAEGTLLADGSVLITGGLGHDGLPVGVSELILPPGAAVPDAAELFARARREKEEHDRLVAERDAAVAEVARLQSELARVQAQLTASEAQVRSLEAQFGKARVDLARAQADLSAARAEAARLREVEASLGRQLASAQAAAASASSSAAAGDPQQARDEFVAAVLDSKMPLPSGAFEITSDEVANYQLRKTYGTLPPYVPKPKR